MGTQTKTKGKWKKPLPANRRRGAMNPQCGLTPETITRFCRLVRRGLPFADCCDYMGIRYGTFLRWRRRGEDYLAAAGTGDEVVEEEEAIFGEFVQRLKRAFARWKLERVDKLHKSRDWVREMTILERRDRVHFGRQEQAGGDDEEYEPDEKFL